jgi:hypothetical protein
MPTIYIIVSLTATVPFEAKTPKKFDPAKPSIRAIDITSTGESTSAHPTSFFPDPEKVVDPSTHNIYTIACEVLNPGPIIASKIALGTTSYATARQKLDSMSDYVTEADAERLQYYTDGVQTKSRAVAKWEGTTCVKVRVGERKVLWYEMLSVECEEVVEEDGADERGQRKRVKLPVRDRGKPKEMEKEHQYADVGMEVDG